MKFVSRMLAAIVVLSPWGSISASAQGTPYQPHLSGAAGFGTYPAAPYDPTGHDLNRWAQYTGPSEHYLAESAPYAAVGLIDRGAQPDRRWFFGAYALYMSRDDHSFKRFAVLDDAPGTPYYSSPEDIVLGTRDIQPDPTWGAEIRFGSTLGWGAAPGGQHQFAWELVYWGLAEDEQIAAYSMAPDPTLRLYYGVGYWGLEYNRDGTMPGWFGFQPLDFFTNHYSLIGVYNLPFRLLGVQSRNDFQAQNLELNFLKLPLYDRQVANSSISVTTVGGVRYLKFDEQFQNALMFTTVGGLAPPHPNYPNDPTEFTGFGDDNWNLYHDIEVDNQLVGFQLGANLNWAVSRRWDFFCDGMFGVYNNRIEVFQHVYNGGDGILRFTIDQTPAVVKGKKDELALMGELRTGMGFQVTSHCRLTAAHRVMAISGVALAVEQFPVGWTNASEIGTVQSNSSFLLHGIQLGAEFVY